MQTQSAQLAAIQDSLKEWRQLLGDERVRNDAETLSRFARSTLPAGTVPAGVVYPSSTEEVQEVVRIARAAKVALYPISRGKNWGYGDACAVGPNHVIVDLSLMNRIVEVNQELAYAVIEPGVTQQQFFDYLQENKIPLWFDCTGSGPEASIIGNTIERGFGHTPYGDHFYNACGMEIVLGDGRLLRTGYGHYRDAKAAHVYKWGIGPYLDGLFSQSNMGIMTGLTIWLMPKPDCFKMFVLPMPKDEDLPRMVEALRPLKLKGQVRSLVHIGNDYRLISSFYRYPYKDVGGVTPLPDSKRRELRKKSGFGAWNISGAIYGSKQEVRAVQREIRKALRGLGTTRFIGPGLIRIANWLWGVFKRRGILPEFQMKLGALVKVAGLLQGQPTDAFMFGSLWRLRTEGELASLDPLENNAGLMFISPIMPMTGEAAKDLVGRISPVFVKHGFEPLITVSLITERAMVAVTNISYDRECAEETERARRCYDELFEMVMAEGYVPYRASIGSMHYLGYGSDVFWDVVRDIKGALDPDGVIAKGRYEPEGAREARSDIQR